VERVCELVSRRPETAQSLSAFLTLIDPRGPASQRWKSDARSMESPPVGAPQAKAVEEDSAHSPVASNELVPVVGSTAAGPARFWREIMSGGVEGDVGGDEANKRLVELLDRCRQRSSKTDLALLSDAPGAQTGADIALIQFSQPDELGLIEFLSCRAFAGRPSRLVAWRIDGESMSPRFRDRDFVLVSPDQPAIDGFPCVAHQRGQIGANCKIFKQDGADIVLVPVNEAHSPQRFPAAELVWANRVLYSARLAAADPR
jgi:hypothetical protein